MNRQSYLIQTTRASPLVDRILSRCVVSNRDMQKDNPLDNHDGVITDLEPDILECEVKWALESITTKKLVEVMEFQLSCFKSWKMML